MDAQKFNRLLGKIKYDKSAAGIIYDEFNVRLKAHIQGRFGELLSPEDISHEVFEKLLKLENQDYVEYPTAWLFRLADNYAIDVLRASHPEEELTETLSADFDIERTIVEGEVKDAMLKLDEIPRRILYMHYWEGYKLEEIAVELNLSYSNVRTIASRTYKLLKTYL